MKRFVLTVLLSIAFCFAACTHGTGEATAVPLKTAPSATQTAAEKVVQGWDFDNRFGGGQCSVVETDAAYYYTAPGGTYLYYYDKVSGERDVLCGRPECIHDVEPENKSCNGFVRLYGTLGYWDDRLHYLTYSPGPNGNVALFSMKLDGTDKRFDTQMSIVIGSVYYTPQRLDYHRGMLYSYCTNEIVRNGVPSCETCIFRMDPKTGELKKLFSLETDHSDSDPSLFYAGKYVYFSLDHREKTDDNWITYLDIRRYDIETEQIEDLYHFRKEGYLGARMRIWVDSEDLIYLMPCDMLDGVTNKLYQIFGGELCVAVDFETEGIGGISNGIAYVLSTPKNRMEVRRLDGSVIYSGAWELDSLRELISGKETDFYVGDAFGNENELLVSINMFKASNNPPSSTCLVKYDLTKPTPEATVLAFDPWQ
ncbi:MAG: hypothetical protein IJK88_04320 [Clostridia bacterium]|nr:hypothetical protein [Clostridia bacterium]